MYLELLTFRTYITFFGSMLPKSWYFIFNNWTPVKQNRTDESVVAHLKTN